MMDTMIAPVLALAAWSLVAMFWMFALRIPAMQKAGIKPQDATPEAMQTLPRHARQTAANYMHLMEQPTIFYATAFAIAVGGLTEPLQVQLAWTYVGLRVVHTLIQNTFNHITLRFTVFIVASFVLVAMVGRAAMALCAAG